MVKTNVRCAGASDPGRIRGNNEDAFHMDADRGIFLVVDGIGGQNAGEKAAAIAVERVRARLERQTGSVEQRVREAIAMANNEILRTARANTEFAGMACVLTVVVLENGTAVVGRGGRDYWTDIKLETLPDVSREHFRLRRDAASGQFFLKDLSQLGTTIDGAKAPSSMAIEGGEKRDLNLEAPVPARARIGLAGVVFLEFRSATNG